MKTRKSSIVKVENPVIYCDVKLAISKCQATEALFRYAQVYRYTFTEEIN